MPIRGGLPRRPPTGAVPRTGGRAVVLGASISGLLAARVLAEAYPEVVLVDRDALPAEEPATVRRGAPQARHTHALLAGGHRVLEELFPGLTAELEAAGAPVGDLLADTRFWVNDVQLCRGPSGMLALTASRALLESRLRARVRTQAGVTLTGARDVVGPVVATGSGDGASAARVTGVRLAGRDGGDQTVLDADLVVDATGRGSRTPRWLQDLGYTAPSTERVPIGLAYATRRYRLRREDIGGDVGILVTPSPRHPRGAGLALVEGGVGMLTLSGMLGQQPPTTPDGFVAYARSLPVPDVHEAVRDADPLDDPAPYRFPASRRLRYDRLRHLPAGLLVVGDAVSSFNPVYGQGMSVAAMEALVLRRHVDGGRSPDPVAFQRDVARVVRTAWELAAGGDLAFPAVPGRRTPRTRLANAYITRLHRAAADDPQLSRAFVRVAGLVDPPAALVRPTVVSRVLLPRPRRVARAEGAPQT